MLGYHRPPFDTLFFILSKHVETEECRRLQHRTKVLSNCKKTALRSICLDQLRLMALFCSTRLVSGVRIKSETSVVALQLGKFSPTLGLSDRKRGWSTPWNVFLRLRDSSFLTQVKWIPISLEHDTSWRWTIWLFDTFMDGRAYLGSGTFNRLPCMLWRPR